MTTLEARNTMQNLALTHLNLFDGKLDSDLHRDLTILVKREKRGEAACKATLREHIE
jgi:hypothetical protein